jgi:hypothetical protein
MKQWRKPPQPNLVLHPLYEEYCRILTYELPEYEQERN